MIKVITYGTFDLLHYGHINLLNRAKAFGDFLVVGVSTDEMCLTKGKQTVLDINKRMELVSSIKCVDLVIPEHNMAQKIEDVKKYNIDIFILGDDYKETFLQMAEYEEVNKLCKIIFLERTPEISTTILKKELLERNK